jgi:hypothetical protein
MEIQIGCRQRQTRSQFDINRETNSQRIGMLSASVTGITAQQQPGSENGKTIAGNPARISVLVVGIASIRDLAYSDRQVDGDSMIRTQITA